MASWEEMQFSQKAIALGFLNSQQLNECLQLQQEYEKQGQNINLIPLMLQKGYLQAQQIELIKTQGSANSSDVISPNSFPPFIGRYKILQELGQGGMGMVYKAYDSELKRIVALKLLINREENSQDIQRFLREAQAMASLTHPNIIPVYDFRSDRGNYFFTMKFIAGQSLREILDKSLLSIEQTVEMIAKVCDALEYAHTRGIIHRDLKPANIMIDESQSPQVMDFGLAKLMQVKDKLSQTGMVVGTPQYMSPEQITGKIRNLDVRSDVYSLGVILYEMLVGQPPFHTHKFVDLLEQIQHKVPSSPKQNRPEIPDNLANICLKALEKKPDMRYQTSGQLAKDLRKFSSGDVVKVQLSHSGWQSILNKIQQSPGLVAGIVFSFLLTIIAVVFALSTSPIDKVHTDEKIKVDSPTGEHPDRPLIRIDQPKLEEKQNVQVPANVWKITISGTILVQNQVEQIVLNKSPAYLDDSEGKFQGEVSLVYGKNTLEMIVLSKGGNRQLRYWEITRLQENSADLPDTPLKYRAGLHNCGVYQSKDILLLRGTKWKVKTLKEVQSASIVSDGVIYCASHDGRIYALDCNSGQYLWHFQTMGTITSSPALLNGLLYFGSTDRYLYALSIAQHKPQWRYLSGGAIISSPAATEKYILFGSNDFYVYSLDPNGVMIWKTQTQGPIHSSPCVANGKVYIASDDYNIYALDVYSGQILWRFKTGAQIGCTPAFANNTIYCGSLDFHMYALDAETGDLKWKFKTSGRTNSSPAATKDSVYFGSDDGKIYALDAAKGQMKWSYQTFGFIASAPAITSQMLYIGTHQRFIYALELSNGQCRWKFKTNSSIHCSPILYDGVLYCGSDDYYIYALW